MSENDTRLIDEAWSINCIDWPQIDGMIEKAESEEAKERLRTIQKHKYHLEEYEANL